MTGLQLWTIDKQLQVDYKQVFYSACHGELFTKLSAFGITHSSLSSLEDILRNQYPVNNARFTDESLVSGYGSSLYLFLIYISNVYNVITHVNISQMTYFSQSVL